MEEIDVYLARVGGMVPCGGGIYAVNDKLMEMNDLRMPNRSAQQMGCQFVTDFEAEFGGKGYVINDSSVDEFIDVARVTGMPGMWRDTLAHTLNQKEAGERAAKSHGKKYEEMNLIIAHLGGGISIGAHQKGRMIDTTNLFGEGPMSPTRTGAIPLGTVLMALMTKQMDVKTCLGMSISKGGGLTAHLGTEDGREIQKRIADGDKYAELIYNGMIYQIGQSIARMAAALEGKVDAIVLTGGLSHSDYIRSGVAKYCGWIAPIDVFAGEFEAEAMISSVLKILNGEEPVKEYTGLPVFDPKKYQ